MEQCATLSRAQSVQAPRTEIIFLLRNCLCLLTLQSLMISRTAAHQCMDQFHAQPQHFAQVIMYKHKITSLFTPLLLGYAMQSVVY